MLFRIWYKLTFILLTVFACNYVFVIAGVIAGTVSPLMLVVCGLPLVVSYLIVRDNIEEAKKK